MGVKGSKIVRPGYKLTDVGVIPGDWKVNSLSELLSGRPSYGIGAPAIPYSPKFPTYIRITDISDDRRFRPTERVSVNKSGFQNYYLQPGDLVFART